ncbi:MAG TPA: hypothetical protein VF941_22325, partial [Clostridia bacterium]
GCEISGQTCTIKGSASDYDEHTLAPTLSRAFEGEVISIDEYRIRMFELREKKNELNEKIDAFNKKLERSDSLETKLYNVLGKVTVLIENLDKLDYNLKETVLKKLVKRIFISSDYSLKFEYTFEED